MLADALYGAEAAAGESQDGLLPDGGDLGLDRYRDELFEEGEQHSVLLSCVMLGSCSVATSSRRHLSVTLGLSVLML